MNRTQLIRDLVGLTTNNFDIFISGPRADMNLTGGVDYRIRARTLTLKQKEQIARIARQLPGVDRVHITKINYVGWPTQDGGNINISFRTRAGGKPL